MGQAKQRGTFEERRQAAIDRDRKIHEATTMRRPSPKHIAMLGMIAGMCSAFLSRAEKGE